jgi:hypothetical protein
VRIGLSVAMVTFIVGIATQCSEHMPCQHAACFEEPTVVERLELHGACGERLFAIERTLPHAPLRQVGYGVVPAGYRQIFLVAGRPRSLESGERIVLLWRTSDTFVQHWGAAISASAVHYGGWSSGPAARPNSQLFAPGGKNEAQALDCRRSRKCAG